MKKVLSSLLLASATIMTFGQNQVLVNDNYNNLAVGNMGTDVTGNTPSTTSGYYTAYGSNSDYQVAVIDAPHGNSFKITTGNGAPPATGANTNNRISFKPIATTASAANNILSGSLEIFTGPATGAGKMQIALYDATLGIVGINYDFTTKKISGMGRLTPVPTVAVPAPTAAFYNIPLGTATYPANTWVSVMFTYNKTTGAYTWKTPENTFSFNNTAYTFTPGMVPEEFDVVALTMAGNTVSNISAVDNINVVYGNTATLGVNDQNIKTIDKIGVTIYPNPTTDILNIKSESKINNVTVVDMTGRNIDVKLENNQVNVQALPVGSYLINIETKDGITTEKFIKK